MLYFVRFQTGCLCDSPYTNDPGASYQAFFRCCAASVGLHLTLGYRQATALCKIAHISAEKPLCWGHEFHRSHLSTTDIAVFKSEEL